MENFDELALTWDNEPKRIQRAKIVADEIMKAIPGLSEMSGLEYGCGTGLLSFFLQPRLKHITVGDNSQGMLKVLTQKVENAKIKNMSPVMLDLSEGAGIHGQYDIIYTLMTLHHIVDTDKVIDAFSRMLKTSGYLCIADLDKEDGSFHGEGFIGHNGFDQEELTEKLEKYGFDQIKWKICFENIRKSEDGTERKYPLFMMIGKRI
ncbi:MAG: class I SAM-dependent methyltransferase [Clostridia bacterium]|nr:class I SAM-dependent methyltransferase [Clostridia bacterium]